MMMKKQRTQVTLHKQRGMAIIEFSIVLPFLLLMTIMMAEIGFLMHQQISLSKSIQTGSQYLSVNVTTGAGRVDITAQKIQDTRNTVLYGNTAGVGTPVIDDLALQDISITCTNGVLNGYCAKNNGLTPITLEVNYTYTPVLGELFDTVTGFNFFPYPLSAITIVEPI